MSHTWIIIDHDVFECEEAASSRNLKVHVHPSLVYLLEYSKYFIFDDTIRHGRLYCIVGVCIIYISATCMLTYL